MTLLGHMLKNKNEEINKYKERSTWCISYTIQNKMIPQFLYEMLESQYGNELTHKIIEGYCQKRPVTLRINTLKTNANTIKQLLNKEGIAFEEVAWNENALVLQNVNEPKIRDLEIYKNGEIYLQSLSSMMPVIAIQPKAKENILDMAAAPGGKTTQIATITQNEAFITACEKNKIRAERLKYNIQKQGATSVNVLLEDARNLSNYFSFDKILLDAPCSGSGTIYSEDANLEKVFTQELVQRSVKTQYELLKKAINILKQGQEMLYSTCSILEAENEKNVEKILKTNIIEIVPIDKNLFLNVPFLKTSIEGTITVCPNRLYEGFFMAKLRKKKI